MGSLHTTFDGVDAGVELVHQGMDHKTAVPGASQPWVWIAACLACFFRSFFWERGGGVRLFDPAKSV